MRQTLYILILALCFGSCNKEDRATETTYQAMVKENFTDPYKQHENIVVDDYIPYTITIEDRDINSEKAEYRLTPLYEGQPYHQMLWKDFGLYSSNEDKVTLKEEKYISFSKKGTHYFYIRPFVPGTFKHIHQLQKFVEGEAIGKPIKLSISFSAITISFQLSRKDINIIIINDGENETDTYISADAIKQVYKSVLRVNRNGKTERKIYSARLHRGITLGKVYGLLTYHGHFNGTIEACEQLTIEQKSGDLSPFVINYYNPKINVIDIDSTL